MWQCGHIKIGLYPIFAHIAANVRFEPKLSNAALCVNCCETRIVDIRICEDGTKLLIAAVDFYVCFSPANVASISVLTRIESIF